MVNKLFTYCWVGTPKSFEMTLSAILANIFKSNWKLSEYLKHLISFTEIYFWAQSSQVLVTKVVSLLLALDPIVSEFDMKFKIFKLILKNLNYALNNNCNRL